jgi:ankyrin repeat protein
VRVGDKEIAMIRRLPTVYSGLWLIAALVGVVFSDGAASQSAEPKPAVDPKFEAILALHRKRDPVLERLAAGDTAGFLGELDRDPELLGWRVPSAYKGQDDPPFSNDTPLRIAVKRNDLDFARRLLDRWAKTDAKDSPDFALADAVSAEMAELLIARGALVEPQEKFVDSPLFRVQTAEVAEVLLRHGADVRRVGERGRTALHFAAATGRLDIARWLLDHGADVDAHASYSQVVTKGKPPQVFVASTPLYETVWDNQVEVARLLLERGAKCDFLNDRKNRPLDSAVWKKRTTLVRMLLDHGARISREDRAAYELLHTAVRERCDIEMIRMLLDAGAPVNAAKPTDDRGRRCIDPILDDNVYLDERGWTALHVAVHEGRDDVVRLLVERGADLTARSVAGLTPQECAKLDYPKPASIPLQAPLSVNMARWEAEAALDRRRDQGRADAAKFLAEQDSKR